MQEGTFPFPDVPIGLTAYGFPLSNFRLEKQIVSILVLIPLWYSAFHRKSISFFIILKFFTSTGHLFAPYFTSIRVFNMLFYPCNICLLTEFQHNVRSNVVLFKDLYSSFPLFDRVFFKKITIRTLSQFFIFICLIVNFIHFNFIYMKFISF